MATVPRAPLVSPTPARRRLASDAIQNLAGLLASVAAAAPPGHFLFEGAPPRAKRLSADAFVQNAPYGVQVPPQRNLFDAKRAPVRLAADAPAQGATFLPPPVFPPFVSNLYDAQRVPRRLPTDAPLQSPTFSQQLAPPVLGPFDGPRIVRKFAADAPAQVTTFLPPPVFPPFVADLFDPRPVGRKWQDLVFPNVVASASGAPVRPITNLYDPRPAPRARQEWSPPNLAVVSGFQVPPQRNSFDARPPVRRLHDVVVVQGAPFLSPASLPIVNRFDGLPRSRVRVEFLHSNVTAPASLGTGRPPTRPFQDPRPPRKAPSAYAIEIWTASTFSPPPILFGGPRYIVKQPETRAFAIEQDAKRAFIVAQFEPRVYTITSGDHMGFRFSIKEPHELIPLTFDFSPDLLSGETLANAPSVSVAVVRGADPTPSAILNGTAGFDASLKKVIVPVKDGVANTEYQITVTVDTTTSTKRLTLVGVLPVRPTFA